MTQSFEDMIYLFSCGAKGIMPSIGHEININEIYKYAKDQGVWQTVFVSLKKLCNDGELELDLDNFTAFKNQVLYMVASNAKRTLKIRSLIQAFEQSQIKYCILKGEVLAQLYHNPGLRSSGDTDILIDKADKKAALRALKSCGFDIEPQNATSHHIRATHPVAGLVELHLSLYDELFEDVWFDNKALNKEEYIRIKTDDGGEIQTLGITDGLIFVALHCTKHFLSKGVGIKHLMDILLYCEHYRNEIDWDRFNNLMKHLKFKKFIDNIFGIGVNYLNFNSESLPDHTCDAGIMSKILSDIERGGAFGKNESERKGFYLEYTKMRFKQFKSGDYNSYIKRWWAPNIIKALFPHIKDLAEKYPCLKKYPFLYPIMWINRVLRLIISFIKKEKSINTYLNLGKTPAESPIVKQRLDLIHELDMM
ncbi:MAG: hypothetical protein BWY15_01199 [Firmicutes bacterium ADurb.Bin193]|nr:MAG: hypothetical protein BWY15_01199 [Firmicutes bacterium ADurb.Bin193]